MKVIQKIIPKLPIYMFFYFQTFLYLCLQCFYDNVFASVDKRLHLLYTYMHKKIHKVTACRSSHKNAKIQFIQFL
ncbi:hypothetical protein OQH61_03065 [Helicobacter sp. MIT 21-1697]|uniref:hypothetical protein n=1 Tax=Helicobacter sp. MIT 21-1697 TaxID=2993733 RepID=UPI00224B2ABB|nr:hypothetical protein [Helicobacter sp. MIT 21-1697]MCX2716712.1 hypothetical protein [Helicobacter sp. MIT 21-1697]